jgi:hypothetical protein
MYKKKSFSRPATQHPRGDQYRHRSSSSTRDHGGERSHDYRNEDDSQQQGPQKTQLFPLEVDVLERLKKEAHYKRLPVQVLINQLLREKFFNPAPRKTTEQLITFKKCPNCGFAGKHQDKEKEGHTGSGSGKRLVPRKNPWKHVVQFFSQKVSRLKKIKRS